MSDPWSAASDATKYLVERLAIGEESFRELPASAHQYRVVKIDADASSETGWLTVELRDTATEATRTVAIAVRLIDHGRAHFIDGPRHQLEAFLGSGLYLQESRALLSHGTPEQRVDGRDYF